MASDYSGRKMGSLNPASIILDPGEAAARLRYRSSWLYPLLIVSAGSLLLGIANLPAVAGAVQSSLPAGLPADHAEQYMNAFVRYQKTGIILSPLVILLKWLSAAAVLFVSCTMLDIKTKYRDLFALISQCGIISLLQDATFFVVIRLRSEPVNSLEDLVPRLGLDLFFPHAGRIALLILNYCSIFNLLYAAVLTVALAALGKCSKTRALIATLPLWLLPLLFAMSLMLLGKR